MHEHTYTQHTHLEPTQHPIPPVVSRERAFTSTPQGKQSERVQHSVCMHAAAAHDLRAHEFQWFKAFYETRALVVVLNVTRHKSQHTCSWLHQAREVL